MKPTNIDFDWIDENGPLELDQMVQVPVEELDHDEFDRISPVDVRARAEKGDLPGEYRVSGRVSFTADLVCARCADPSPFAGSSSFNLRFLPRPEEAGSQDSELEITPEELDDEFYESRQIELRPLVMEQVQLAVPMKPLCDEACQGLCPVCKANRNRTACECGEDSMDARWDALRGIREQLVKKKEI